MFKYYTGVKGMPSNTEILNFITLWYFLGAGKRK